MAIPWRFLVQLVAWLTVVAGYFTLLFYLAVLTTPKAFVMVEFGILSESTDHFCRVWYIYANIAFYLANMYCHILVLMGIRWADKLLLTPSMVWSLVGVTWQFIVVVIQLFTDDVMDLGMAFVRFLIAILLPLSVLALITLYFRKLGTERVKKGPGQLSWPISPLSSNAV